MPIQPDPHAGRVAQTSGQAPRLPADLDVVSGGSGGDNARPRAKSGTPTAPTRGPRRPARRSGRPAGGPRGYHARSGRDGRGNARIGGGRSLNRCESARTGRRSARRLGGLARDWGADGSERSRRASCRTRLNHQVPRLCAVDPRLKAYLRSTHAVLAGDSPFGLSVTAAGNRAAWTRATMTTISAALESSPRPSTASRSPRTGKLRVTP